MRDGQLNGRADDYGNGQRLALRVLRQKGQFGSPIFSNAGAVVGVLVGMSDDVAIALPRGTSLVAPGRALSGFLTRNRVLHDNREETALSATEFNLEQLETAVQPVYCRKT